MSAELKLRRLSTTEPGFEEAFAPIEQRRLVDQARIQEAVAAIVDDVRQRGDAAVLDAIERFDGYRLEAAQLTVGADEIERGAAELGAPEAAALRTAADRVRRFHERAKPKGWTETSGDETLGQLIRPLASAAIYVPAGTAPLASSVLMLGIPALVAGVAERAMSTPGQRLQPAMLAAAQLAEVSRLHRVGGAQAVAALAYGTESIAPVDMIAGPGNAYVQEAKRQVFGQVGIDAEAGPSEVFIVAEAGASARYLAADLLAQAEHDMSSVVLASPDAGLVQATLAELERQIDGLPREQVARASLAERSALIVTRDLDEAFDLANRYAAEHLQLFVDDAERWLPRVQHAGAVFVGPYNPVPLGDYVAGPSHVLPTGGTARFFSVLGVENFQKRMSLIQVGESSYRRIAPDAARLAEMEGLDAHARSLLARLENE